MSNSSVALVTGATGFIGRRLCQALQDDGSPYRGMIRAATQDPRHVLGDLSDGESLARVCQATTTVFHCAGYAHAFSSLNGNDAAKHWQINYEGTLNLLKAAGEAGVKSFVFLSSIKAMAEPGASCADENFPGEPDTAYGKSKRAAEAAVLDAGQHYGMHVVNLRLCMAYGAGGRGNLERMGCLVKRGVFPALPETGNHRSMIHVDDIVRAIRLVVADSRAEGQTYILAGDEAPSGRQLYQSLRVACGMAPANWAVPRSVLAVGATVGDRLEKLLNRRLPFDHEVLDRLLGSAWYSAEKIQNELGWRPQVSLASGLKELISGNR